MKRPFWIVMCCAAIIAGVLQAAKQPWPIVDPTELGLEITETTTAQAIQKENIRFVAQPPDKLVVVTLKGKTRRDCRFVLDNTAFAAVFEESSDTGAVTQSIVRSKAIFVSGEWSIPSKPGGYIVIVPGFEKGETVEIKAAFQLPVYVSVFTVTCPTAVKGSATLPGQARLTSQLP